MPPIRTTEGGASGRRGRVIAGWCGGLNRMPLNARAGLVLTVIAALLLLVSGARASAAEQPAARAPLPPPLQNVPVEAGELQRPTGTPDRGAERGQSAPGPPTISFGRTRPLQKKPNFAAGPHHGAAIAAKQRPPVRSSDRSKDGASRQRDRRSIALEAKRGRDRLPIGPRMGQLSPPNDDTTPGIESITNSRVMPPQAQSLYYPDYFAGPPAYGYAPSYPFTWAPRGPGVFR
jgi:hypothetical protein